MDVPQLVPKLLHMMPKLILASGSEIRSQLLRNAGLTFDVVPADLDEAALKSDLLERQTPASEIALHLAQAKAAFVSRAHPKAHIIGCDQVLLARGQIYSKPTTREEAAKHLRSLRDRSHQLLSAVVLYHQGAQQWSHISPVTLTMRAFSDAYLNDYIARNWPEIRYSVGGYMIEKEGARLFSEIQGDSFAILGLPLIELLSYLSEKGIVPG